jgi:hypothetical protein
VRMLKKACTGVYATCARTGSGRRWSAYLEAG